MIIKSFKLFESHIDKNIFIIEVNDKSDLVYVLNYLKKIDENMYNQFLIDNEWKYPNWVFVYKYDNEYDKCLIFSYNPTKEELNFRMEKADNIYQHIFKINELDKLRIILLGNKFIKNMYSKRIIER